ncbi:MAG: hypothetical protein V8R67_01145 [Eubacterium sp.]
MKKKIILCMVLAGLLFSLAGCAEESGQPEAGVQQENSKTSEEEFAGDGAWTILVYLCGTDSRERLWRGDNGFERNARP